MLHALAFQAAEKSPTPKKVSKANISVNNAHNAMTTTADIARNLLKFFIENSLSVNINYSYYRSRKELLQ